MHTEYYSPNGYGENGYGWDGYDGNGTQGGSEAVRQLLNDATELLNAAENLLATLDPNGGQYQAVRNAADYLRMLIGSDNPGQAEITSAMTTLTQAMAGIY